YKRRCTVIQQDGVKIASTAGRGSAAMKSARRQAGGGIEINGLNGVVVLKTNTLPAADHAAFDHEQRHAPGKPAFAFQQLAKNFRLRGGFLDGGHCSAQHPSRGLAWRWSQGSNFLGCAADNLGAQAGQCGGEHFRYRLFDNGLYLLRAWHLFAWPRLYGLAMRCQSARLLKSASLVS